MDALRIVITDIVHRFAYSALYCKHIYRASFDICCGIVNTDMAPCLTYRALYCKCLYRTSQLERTLRIDLCIASIMVKTDGTTYWHRQHVSHTVSYGEHSCRGYSQSIFWFLCEFLWPIQIPPKVWRQNTTDAGQHDWLVHMSIVTRMKRTRD